MQISSAFVLFVSSNSFFFIWKIFFFIKNYRNSKEGRKRKKEKKRENPNYNMLFKNINNKLYSKHQLLK